MPFAPAKAQRAARFLELGVALHDLANGCAIDVIDGGEIEDEAFLVAQDVRVDFLIDLTAIGAHDEPARHFKDHDAGLDLFFCEFHDDGLRVRYSSYGN